MIVNEGPIRQPGRNEAIPSRFLDRDDLNQRALNVQAVPTPRPADAQEPNEPNEFRDWLRNQVKVTTQKINRLQKVEGKLREQACLKAKICWDSDRRIESAILGARLSEDPATVLAGLRRTPQGCEWLLERWGLLIHAARTSGDWTPPQKRLASTMLGLPNVFQNEANPLGSVQVGGEPIESTDDLILLAQLEARDLMAQRDQLAPFDEAARLLAEKGELDDAHSPELRQLSREERTLYLRLRWLVRQLEIMANDPPTPRREPEVVEVAPEPPKAEETQKADDQPEPPKPPCPDDRREARLQKAESRRQARERKLERLRA
jgi:hypothetical protein